MASATRLEYATACTPVFAPSTTSPLATTPGRVVWPSSSVTSRPRRSVSIPFVAGSYTHLDVYKRQVLVEFQHLAVIHFIDMVARQDEHVLGISELWLIS